MNLNYKKVHTFLKTSRSDELPAQVVIPTNSASDRYFVKMQDATMRA